MIGQTTEVTFTKIPALTQLLPVNQVAKGIGNSFVPYINKTLTKNSVPNRLIGMNVDDFALNANLGKGQKMLLKDGNFLWKYEKDGFMYNFRNHAKE